MNPIRMAALAAITALSLSLPSYASAQTPAAHCQVGIGIAFIIPSATLSKNDLLHLDQVKISAHKPLVVVEVVPDSPATRATTVLRGSTRTVAWPVDFGDTITAIDGKSIYGMTTQQVVDAIDNGPAGSTLTIHITRDGGHIGRTLTIKRDTFCTPAPAGQPSR